MEWEVELERWAQWEELAIFLQLQLKVLLDLLLAAFLLVLQELEALLLEVLHNLDKWEEELQEQLDYSVQVHQSEVVLLPPTIPIIFHSILLKSSEPKNQSNLTKKKPKMKKLQISNPDLQNMELVL